MSKPANLDQQSNMTRNTRRKIKRLWKKKIFTLFFKESTVVGTLSRLGRAFQSLWAAGHRAPSPMLCSLVLRTLRRRRVWQDGQWRRCCRDYRLSHSAQLSIIGIAVERHAMTLVRLTRAVSVLWVDPNPVETFQRRGCLEGRSELCSS